MGPAGQGAPRSAPTSLPPSTVEAATDDTWNLPNESRDSGPPDFHYSALRRVHRRSLPTNVLVALSESCLYHASGPVDREQDRTPSPDTHYSPRVWVTDRMSSTGHLSSLRRGGTTLSSGQSRDEKCRSRQPDLSSVGGLGVHGPLGWIVFGLEGSGVGVGPGVAWGVGALGFIRCVV